MGSLTAEQVNILRTLEWVEDDHLLIPVIQPVTVKSLQPILDRIGARASRVVIDDQAVIVESFAKSPYSDFLEAGGDYIQACYHILFGLILEEMATTGVLPGFHPPVPEHFGVFLLAGRLF